MLDLARRHQALAEDYRESFEIAASKLLAQPSWTLEASVALIHIQEQGIIIGPVRALLSYLDTAQPALDAFVRLQEQR